MMTSKIKFMCNRCGSTEVFRSATITWNIESQGWMVAEMFDDACGGECDGNQSSFSECDINERWDGNEDENKDENKDEDEDEEGTLYVTDCFDHAYARAGWQVEARWLRNGDIEMGRYMSSKQP